jgi:hypothetical protein
LPEKASDGGDERRGSFGEISLRERMVTMLNRFMQQPVALAIALLLSCGMLVSMAPAQDFEEEGYTGLYEEDNYEDSWYYDAYETARRDDAFEGNQWYNEEPRYRGFYNNEWDDDDWFYDAYEERDDQGWWDWDLL